MLLSNAPATDGWKFSEAAGSGESPFSFHIDYALLSGGSGVNIGDVILYFLVAQDGQAVSLTGSSGVIFASPPTSVALAAPAFPVSGGIGSYTTGRSLSGTVTVGPGGDFSSLTNAGGLFSAINDGVITGEVTAQITGDLFSESGTFALNAQVEEPPGSLFPIRIHPVGGNRGIVGSNSGALLRLNAVDRVTLDGSLGGTGTDHSLSIFNNHAGTLSAVVWLQSNGFDGATDNTIRNVGIRGRSKTETLFGIGSGGSEISLTSAGINNHRNTFLNNRIRSVQFGIFSLGGSAFNKNNGNVFAGNLMDAAAPENLGQGGILLGFETNVAVTNNRIVGISRSNTNGSDVFGISLGLGAFGVAQFTGNEVTDVVVTGNVIRDITHTGTFSVGGIVVAATTSGTTLIANNSIAGIGTNATIPDLGAGIFLGGGTGSTTRVLFNSVSVSGAFDTDSTAAESNFAVAIASGDPQVELRNNAFSNTLVYTTSTVAQGASYVIGAGSTTFDNLITNHNLLFAPAVGKFVMAQTGSLARTGGTDHLALADWQLVTNKETNSLSVDPLFLSSADLTVLSGSPLVNGGTPVAGVTTDIAGALRSSTAPTIGAYESQAALEAWRQFHFGSTANSGDSANDFDFDKDGLVNLIEFAFGLDPKSNSAHLLPQAQRVGNELVITFTPPPGVSGITYGAEASETLAADDWEPVLNAGSAPQVVFRVMTGPEKAKFLRLIVSAP